MFVLRVRRATCNAVKKYFAEPVGIAIVGADHTHSALFDKIIAQFKLYIYRKYTYAPSIKTIRVLIKTRAAVSKGRIKLKIRIV